jgi:hypothetical protein
MHYSVLFVQAHAAAAASFLCKMDCLFASSSLKAAECEVPLVFYVGFL